MQQAIESRGGIGQCDTNNTVLDFATITVVLAFDTGGVFTALGRPCLVDTADCVGMVVLLGHDSLTAITHFLFIPNDRFEETLKRSRGNMLMQRGCLDVFPLHVREQIANLSQEYAATIATGETAGKPGKRPSNQFSEICYIHDSNGAAFLGFPCEKFKHTEGRFDFNPESRLETAFQNTAYDANIDPTWRCPGRTVNRG